MSAKKKTTKKTAAKKVANKTTTKKPVAQKTPAKKAAVKKTAPQKAGTKKAAQADVKKAKTASKPKEETPIDSKAKEIVLNARKRTSTPSVFKQRKSKNTPVVFTMEDVEEMLKSRKPGDDEKKTTTKAAPKKKTTTIEDDAPVEHRNHAAASLADILGFNPAEKAANQTEDKVPAKFSKYYKALLELRDHVNDGLQLHTADTLKRSNKEDSGDLSGYGQHMADAGTDTFDRDFALSLVSSEQEALYEIEEAIQRIFDGSYGVCEITGEPIAKDRLMAVPFTRYSLEGQRELEKQRRNKVQRVGVLSEDMDESLSFTDDDSDN